MDPTPQPQDHVFYLVTTVVTKVTGVDPASSADSAAWTESMIQEYVQAGLTDDDSESLVSCVTTVQLGDPS